MVRKHVCGIITCLALGCALLPGYGQTRAPKLLDFTRVKLDNGLTVLLKEYHKLPLIDFRLTIKGGAALDPEGKEGVANLTAGLLRKGTQTRTATQIAEELDFVGATLGASATADYSSVRAEFLRKDLDSGLELFADVVLNPAFSQEEIERLRKDLISAILQGRENPGQIASLQFNAFLFKNHPYGRRLLGTERSVTAITREDIVSYHRRVYTPEKSVLAVVGDFTTSEMVNKIKRAFGSWPRGEGALGAAPPQPGPPEKWQVLIVDKPDVTQTQIRIGSFGIERKNPDYHAILVANTILGGGFTSRLVEEIRVNRGLTYGISSFFDARLQRGAFIISTFTKNDTAYDAIQVVLEELKKFRDGGATPEELAKAKSYIVGQFPLGLQTPESLADQMIEIEFYGLPDDYADTFQQKIRAVTLDEANRVIKAYFPYEQLVVVVVSKAAAVQAKLESLGPVRVKSYLEN